MSPFEQHPFRQAASLHRGLRRRLVSAYQPERLEPRLALAGVVGLVVTGDVLTITGDALANELRIDQVALNQIRVAPIHDKFLPTGLRDARGTVGHEPLVFSGIRDVVVRLRGGDDRLFIGPRDGLVDIGRGGEPEDFRSPVTVLRSLMVDAGTGADFIQAYRLDVEGGATFLGGPGADDIGLKQTRAFGSLSVNGGLDHDVVSLRDATSAAGDVTLVGGPGFDQFFVSDGIEVGRNLTLLGGPGEDRVSVSSAVVHGGLRIEGGLGRDSLYVVHAMQVLGAATIAAGAGRDSVQVGNGLVVDGLLTVAVGAGDDEVSIVGRVVPQAGMVVELGTGSDQLRTENFENPWGGPVPAQDAAIHTAGDVVIAKGAGRVEAIIDLPGEGTIGRDLVVQSVAAASSVLVRNADVVRHLSVVTGQGVDDVTVAQSRVGENLFLATNAGRDTVALGTTLVAGDTRIEAGAGNDTVELRHVNARTRLFALMGAGDDALTLVNVLLSAAPGDVSLAGGRRGRDSLRLEILRGNGHPSHADFETVTSA